MNSLIDQLFSLEGKVALITGASGGIGRALAVGMAGAGAAVGLHGTSQERLEETLALVQEVGGEGIIVKADLSDAGACKRMIVEAASALGRLDVLINNAGTNRRKPLLSVTEEDYRAIMAVNLHSVLLISQAAHPLLKERGGKIINIGSMTSFIGLAGVSVYGMSKAALAQLTKTMAVEWARDNIQVNCLAPGFIETPLTQEGIWGNPHRRKWVLERIPARRPGLPADLVGAALLLASPASAYLTGQVIAVDGGFLAGGSWDPDE